MIELVDTKGQEFVGSVDGGGVTKKILESPFTLEEVEITDDLQEKIMTELRVYEYPTKFYVHNDYCLVLFSSKGRHFAMIGHKIDNVYYTIEEWIIGSNHPFIIYQETGELITRNGLTRYIIDSSDVKFVLYYYETNGSL